MPKLTITFEIGTLPPGITEADVQANLDSLLSDYEDGRYAFDVEAVDRFGCWVVARAVHDAVHSHSAAEHGSKEYRKVPTPSGGEVYIYRHREIADQLLAEYPVQPYMIRDRHMHHYDDES